MISTEAPTNQPPRWQHDALAELIDIVGNILANRYESPEDLAGDMQQRSTAIATVLASENGNALPELLDSSGAYVMTLQFAAREIAMHTQESPGDIIARLHYAGWERYQASSPTERDHSRYIASKFIARYRNPSISNAVPTDGRSQTA